MIELKNVSFSYSPGNPVLDGISIHFNASFKYYMSEEFFMSLGYDFQIETSDSEKGRHGVVLGVGFQIPLWQRKASTENEAQDESEATSEDSAAGTVLDGQYDTAATSSDGLDPTDDEVPSRVDDEIDGAGGNPQGIGG